MSLKFCYCFHYIDLYSIGYRDEMSFIFYFTFLSYAWDEPLEQREKQDTARLDTILAAKHISINALQ